eukprot:scaffold7349_cov173-Amphora_coffeaeformis.AAC.98
MTKLAVLLLCAIGFGSWSGALAFSPTINKVAKSAVRPLSSSYPQNPSSKEFDLIASNDEWLQQVLVGYTADQRRARGNAEGFLPTAAALILAMTLAATGLGSTEEASMFTPTIVEESPKERLVQQYNEVVGEDAVQLLDQSAGFFFF